MRDFGFYVVVIVGIGVFGIIEVGVIIRIRIFVVGI